MLTGQVGDWGSYFTEEMKHSLDSLIRTEITDSELLSKIRYTVT